MKNFFKILGIIVLAAVMGFSLAACDNPNDPGGDTYCSVCGAVEPCGIDHDEPNPGLFAKAPPIANTDTPIAGVTINSVAAAVTHINNNPGIYTLVLSGGNPVAANLSLTAASSLTIIGVGGEITINHNGTAGERMFHLNHDDASLTLGNNITLVGHTSSTTSLIHVQKGNLVMLPGSKITGHSTSTSDSTVYVDRVAELSSTPSFTMEGGTITGNHNSPILHASGAVGGVSVGRGGTFTMNGGSITGNTSTFDGSSPADVFFGQSTISAALSGNASIGALILNASETATAKIIMHPAFTGTVGILHLRGILADLDAAIGLWVNKAIIVPGSGHILTQADINRFPLGQFRNSGAVNWADISDTHRVVLEGGQGVVREN